MAEARVLMDVKQNLVTPKGGEPLIAATQDFLTCFFLLTQKDIFYDKAEFCRLCAYFADAREHIDLPPPCILKPVALWSGKQLVNVMLRPNKKTKIEVNLEEKARNYSSFGKEMCRNDGYVVFRNAELMCGNLCKGTMGSGSKNGLFYALIRENSTQVAADCLLRVSKFSSRWISNYGMSIGIDDVTPFAMLLKEKSKLIDTGYKQCSEMIDQYKRGSIILKAGCNEE